MKMKRISAATVADAMGLARRELGEDAVLLETQKSPKGKGVIVTFAIEEKEVATFLDDDEPAFIEDLPPEIIPFRPPLSPTVAPSVKRPEPARAEIAHPAIAMAIEALDHHGVPEELHEKLVTAIRRARLKPDALIDVAETLLADAFTQTLSFQPLSTAIPTPPPKALMFVGPHGAGKTSTIAKLATEVALKKLPLAIVSTDRERLAGTDALAKLAEIIGCRFDICDSRAKLKSALAMHVGASWLLIDTSGANIYEFKHMKALGELATLQGIEPILTCPAGMDADEAREMASVFDFLPIQRMIITRVDATRRLKGIFAAMNTGNYAFSNYSQSASPADACQTLTPATLARLMLRHERERMK